MDKTSFTLPEFKVGPGESPESIRKRAIRYRLDIPDEIKNELFRRMIDLFCSLSIYKSARNIMAYFGKVSAGEFNTIPLLKMIINDGKNLFLPRVRKTGENKMDIYRVKDLNVDLEKGMFGIMEPISKPGRLGKIDDLDIIIVPGVIFDVNFTRYGFGKGYYDRFLSQKPQYPPYKIAFSLSTLVVNRELERKETDIPMDIIITEKNIISILQ